MPITHDNLYNQITDFSNLWEAYLSARKGKRYRREIAEFGTRLEENLINIHNHLVWKSWQPGKPRCFRVFEPKQRDIQAPPFADRIVHHALVRIVEPLFDRRFIHHSYACRTDKGSQRAVQALQRMLRIAKHNNASPWVVKADVKSYFASIRHDVLFRAISRVIACPDTIGLWRRITEGYGHDGGVGLPVGALTSQLAANIMLDQVDHAMTDDAGCRWYLRYMDDIVVVATDRQAAREILGTLTNTITTQGLAMNPKTRISPSKSGVDFCGYRTWSTHILPRKKNMLRARRRLRRVAAQQDQQALALQINSLTAYTKHCNAHRATTAIINDTRRISSCR